jgi:DtxR family Mn-dependent transcriptional regulator
VIQQGKLTARAEEYLESILNMKVEGKTILAARLAEQLMVSPPTVASALNRLKRDGLVSFNSRKEISLTKKGELEAISIVRKHRLVERLLTDMLDVEWSECHDEACRIEHAISPMVESKLYERLGRPSTCPHGNPIPKDRTIRLPKGVPLDTVSHGTLIKIVRIAEAATRNAELMRFLQRHAILPGRTFEVKDVAIYAGTITLGSDLREVSLGVKAAGAIWVLPLKG